MGKLQQVVGPLNDGDRLRAHIDVCEKLMPTVHRPESAREFLINATQAHKLLDSLEVDGSDIRPELGRLNSLGERSARNARRIVGALGGTAAYVEIRAQIAEGSIDPWWRLDDVLARAKRRTLTAIGIVIAGLIAIVAAGFVFRDFLFPPNPVGDAVTEATRVVAQAKDYPAAMTAIEAGLAITPTNSELLLWRGALLEAMKHPDSQTYFDKARASMTALDFQNNRATVYLRMSDSARALADLDRSIQMDAADPIAYFLRATAYENTGEYQKAIADLEEVSRLAESQKNDQLVAFARVRLGMLMQQNAVR